MKQVLLKRGSIYTADVAAPLPGKDMVLVKTAFSCISAGTEMSGVQQSGEGLVTQAIKHPEYVQMGLEMLKQRASRTPGTPYTESMTSVTRWAPPVRA